MILLLIWLAVAAIIAALYLNRAYSRFSKHGVKYLKPFPVAGNMARVVARRDHLVDQLLNVYNAFPGERFVGHYEFTKPLVVIKDLELIKQIGVKDFDIFLDHRTIVDEDVDKFFGSNLFALKGQKWRDMRSTLSPAFTSAKIRHMVPFMVEVGDQMIAALNREMKEKNVDYLDIEMKDLATRYANDVIASCAFGLKVDSHVEKNNEFYSHGKATSSFSSTQFLKFLVVANFPKLSKWLKVTLFPQTANEFFKDIVLGTMKHRQDNNIVRPDMIQLLMDAKKGNLTHDNSNNEDAGFATVDEALNHKTNRVWSDTDLIAQAVLFFIAGFETVAVTMTFLLFELALNPEVQEKLAAEIREHDRKNNGKFDYNGVQNMKYLDMVVSELLRKWPPALATDRTCLKAYNLGKPNDRTSTDYIVAEGETVWFPIVALHHDPEYFPNPQRFDPERFSEENKHKINQSAYMPFGTGPRNCIGSRFALCEVKVMVYQLLQHMEVSPSKKSCLPIKLSKASFNNAIEGGHWLKLRPRR